MTDWSDRSALYAAAAARARQVGNLEAFTDLIVAARACAAIERQIKRAEWWLEASAPAAVAAE